MARDRAARTRRRFLRGGLALTGSRAAVRLRPRFSPEDGAEEGCTSWAFSTPPPRRSPLRTSTRSGRACARRATRRAGTTSSSPATPRGGRSCSPGLAAELVSLPVDVMLASTRIAITAAKNATATIPIVMTNVGSDPVAFGLVESLARPGGNVTGTANLGVLLTGKRVELLKQTLPALARLAMFQDVAESGECRECRRGAACRERPGHPAARPAGAERERP